MSSREAILGAVRTNKPEPRPLPDVPHFDQNGGGGLVDRFATAFEAMGGTLLDVPPDDPLLPVRQRLETADVTISMASEIDGSRRLDLAAPPSSLADVDIAVVRAAFGVAETGSIALTERELGINTLAYLAQHLVVLLDPADILVDLHQSYQRPEFRDARYIVFHSGPSATADIEGVLIRGAQGVRSLSILLLPRSV